MTNFLISANLKNNNYYSILVIVDLLIKIIYYKPVKVTIETLDLAKVIINMIIYPHKVLESIVINKSLLIISKF